MQKTRAPIPFARPGHSILSLFLSLPLFLLLPPSLLVGSLPAQSSSPDLPEVSKIEGLKEVLSNRLVLHPKGKNDNFFAWVDQRVFKGRLEGETVYLEKSEGTLALIEEGRFVHYREQALFDKSLDFVKARYREEGPKPRTTDYRWEKGKILRHRVHGHKKAKAIPSEGRPALLNMLFKLDHRLPSDRKSKFVLLDTMKGETETVEVERIPGTFTFEKNKCRAYRSSEMGGLRILVHLGSGRILRTEFEKMPLQLTWTRMAFKDLDRYMMFNPILQKKARDKVRAAWKKVGIRWKNKILGMEIALPKKGWERVVPPQGDNVFQFRPRDETLGVFLESLVAPPGMDLDTYVQAILEVYKKEMVPEGKYEIEDLKLGKRPGKKLSFHYKYKRAKYACELRLVQSGSLFFRFGTYFWNDPSRYLKDLSWIWKRLIIRKRR